MYLVNANKRLELESLHLFKGRAH